MHLTNLAWIAVALGSWLCLLPRSCLTHIATFIHISIIIIVIICYYFVSLCYSQPNRSRQLAVYPEPGSAHRFFLLNRGFSLFMGECWVSVNVIWRYINKNLLEILDLIYN